MEVFSQVIYRASMSYTLTHTYIPDDQLNLIEWQGRERINLKQRDQRLKSGKWKRRERNGRAPNKRVGHKKSFSSKKEEINLSLLSFPFFQICSRTHLSQNLNGRIYVLLRHCWDPSLSSPCPASASAASVEGQNWGRGWNELVDRFWCCDFCANAERSIGELAGACNGN